MRSVPSIAFDLHTSRALTCAALVVALLTVLALWVSRAGWMLAVAGTLAIGTYVFFSLRRHRCAVQRLGWQGDGTWALALRDGSDVVGELCWARILGPLLVLRLAWGDDQRATIWVLPDNCPEDVRRRLRVRLSAGADVMAH